MKKVFNIFGYGIIGICVLFFIFVIFGFEFRIVLTGSMRDVYKVGSVVAIKKVDFDKLKINDDITFELNGNAITHRIIEIDYEKEEVVTKGINNNENDGVIQKNQIIGKVKFNIPLIGYLLAFLKNNIIFIILLFGSISLFFIGLKNLKSSKK